MREKLYSDIVGLIAPGEISKYFEIVTINEKRESVSILFEEKATLIPQGLKVKDAVLDGFLNPVDIQTFPFKAKTVYLSIKRRHWKERGKTDKSYHNTYNLHRRGMKTTNEFGDILKEELGLEEDKRMKLPLYPIGRN
ncbi:MAG: hypothetical protein B6D64_07330 [Bacteroidetes bacterium 4484_276]|nr:MAG: hypothetical protein B6D64_07330 [Bacteroidetes bacterium 4484_276]